MRLAFILLGVLFAGGAAAEPECDLYVKGQCFYCDSPLAFEVGYVEDCRRICPDRVAEKRGSDSYGYVICRLKECPQEFSFRDDEGNCFVDKKAASLWDTRHYTSGEKAINGGCPEGKPLKSWDETCHDCHTAADVRVDMKYNYDFITPFACSNRVVLKQGGGNPLTVLSCPAEVPLMDSAGICHRCDEKYPVYMVFNEEKCRQVCEGRRYMSGAGCNLCSVDLSFYKDAESCFSCGGYWDKSFCRVRMPEDQEQRCLSNHDCPATEFCYLNRCLPVPPTNNRWKCLPFRGGDNLSAQNMCQAAGMTLPLRKQIAENVEEIMTICDDEDFTVFVGGEYSSRLGALPAEGYFLSKDRTIRTEAFPKTAGNSRLHLLCVDK